MIPQDDPSIDYLTRSDLESRRNQNYPNHSENTRSVKPDDCGCKKDYPFAGILPKDETYIDFVKDKEMVGMVVNDIGLKCSNIMSFIHNMKNYYPDQILDNNIIELKTSVETLDKVLESLKNNLRSREELAREVLKSDGTWIKRSK